MIRPCNRLFNTSETSSRASMISHDIRPVVTDNGNDVRAVTEAAFH